MKKAFLYISALVVAVSCETMYGPVQTPLAADKADEIGIKVNSTGDNTASFTLTPAGEASYYSYLVDAAEAPEQLDSSLLFSCQYKSVAQGTVKWTAEATSKTIELEGLTPNTTYQIYAVAGSPMGFPGSITVTAFKTSDKVAPELTGAEIKDGVAEIAFSENVVLGEGGTITADYYALNDEGFMNGTPVGTVTADMAKVTIEGNKAAVTFEGIPDGAFYAVSYTDGTFADPSGNKAAPVRSSMKLNGKTYEVEGDGIYGRRNTKAFALGKVAVSKITDWKTPIEVDFGSEYDYGYTYGEAIGTAVYANSGKTTTLKMTPGEDFGYSAQAAKVTLFLPEEPARGDEITLEIKAETFEDFYGNMNEAWKAEGLVYAYNYTLEDVTGSYMAKYIDALSGQPAMMPFEIAAITEADEKSEGFIKGCNVKFTTFMLPAQLPIYAAFDETRGKLTIPTNQIYASAKSGETNVLVRFMTVTGGSQDPETPTVLEMPQSGVLTNQSSMFGILLFDTTGKPLGWNTVCTSFVGEKAAGGNTTAMSLAEGFDFYPLDTEMAIK